MKLWILFLIPFLAIAPVKASIARAGQPISETLAGGPGSNATITDLTFVSDVKAYPNPTTNGTITIAFNYTGEQTITVRVINLIGKEVYSNIAEGGAFEDKISLTDFAKGIYIIEISNGTQKQTKRISYI